MTGMYQSRDSVSQGTINLGTWDPRTFVVGHLVLGRPITPHLMAANTEKIEYSTVIFQVSKEFCTEYDTEFNYVGIYDMFTL